MADKAVVLALQRGDALVAGPFPGVGRVLFGPGGEELPVLAGEVEAVGVGHVEHGAGDVAFDGVGRFGAADAGVDLEGAAAVVAGGAILDAGCGIRAGCAGVSGSWLYGDGV